MLIANFKKPYLNELLPLHIHDIIYIKDIKIGEVVLQIHLIIRCKHG